MNEDRDTNIVRRELRIERAVIGLVVHGYRRDNLGFNQGVEELALAENATAAEVVPHLFWALSRLPLSGDEPDQLLDRLASLAGVRDANDD